MNLKRVDVGDYHEVAVSQPLEEPLPEHEGNKRLGRGSDPICTKHKHFVLSAATKVHKLDLQLIINKQGFLSNCSRRLPRSCPKTHLIFIFLKRKTNSSILPRTDGFATQGRESGVVED